MFKKFVNLTKDERGAVSTDWVTLSGGIMILTLVMINVAQQEMSTHLSTLPQIYTVTSAFE